MTLDKKIWQKAIAQYKAWNDAVFMSQVLERRQKTPAEKWRAFLDLYEFGRRIKPQPGLWDQEQTVRDWERYYSSIHRFEEWRRKRGPAN